MKRKRPSHAALKANKSRKLAATTSHSKPFDDTVLRVYYPVVLSLRSYLLSSLSLHAKKRRRYVAQYGLLAAHQQDDPDFDQRDLATLLDSTLIGSFDRGHDSTLTDRHELDLFAQKVTQSTPGRELSSGSLCQSEVGLHHLLHSPRSRKHNM